jgi:hypothetical protein
MDGTRSVCARLEAGNSKLLDRFLREANREKAEPGHWLAPLKTIFRWCDRADRGSRLPHRIRVLKESGESVLNYLGSGQRVPTEQVCFINGQLPCHSRTLIMPAGPAPIRAV